MIYMKVFWFLYPKSSNSVKSIKILSKPILNLWVMSEILGVYLFFSMHITISYNSSSIMCDDLFRAFNSIGTLLNIAQVIHKTTSEPNNNEAKCYFEKPIWLFGLIWNSRKFIILLRYEGHWTATKICFNFFADWWMETY